MTALAMDVRELSLAEIDMVSGGNWFSSIAEAFANLAGAALEMMVDALEWLHEHFIVTVDPNGGVTVRNR
jgi:hypothetical protein